MSRKPLLCAALLTATLLWPVASPAQLAASRTITLQQPTGTPTAVCAPVASARATTTVTLNRSFYDDFSEGLKLSTATAAPTWPPNYDGGSDAATNTDTAYSWPAPIKRTLPENNEQEAHVNGAYKRTFTKALGINPFTYDSSTSAEMITANRMPSSLAQYLKIGANPHFSNMRRASGIN